ncbi:hypothetical protein BGX29_006169 [Mortierella sp. GBA35]|nr:hypothetical protein BGX29_006169 [Mortierella sp. GBA35]
MTFNTQTTYRLNVDIPRIGYDEKYPEKGGKSSPAPLYLSSLSPTSPTSPTTPSRESIFGLAGNGNGVDTRKGNKRQSKKEAKQAFSKAKSFFSNERTFIHWTKFGMLLGALAMTLLNFSIEGDRKWLGQDLANRVARVGKSVGVTLLLICLLCLVYSAVSYHWRHLSIVKDKGHERYFDRIGPTFLTIALLTTYTMNIVLTIQVSSLMAHDYEPPIYLNNNYGSQTIPTATPVLPSPAESPVPAPSPPPIVPAAASPQRPVFDIPYLSPGSTILIDGDEDDDFEHGSLPDDLDESVSIASASESADTPAHSASSDSLEKDSDEPTRSTASTSSNDDEEADP